MANTKVMMVGVAIATVLTAGLVAKIVADHRVRDTTGSVAALRDSINVLERRVDSLRLSAPGLGEYMTTIQLHAAKLWFAARASNWDLAGYELGELDETMDAARALHVFKDSVDVSAVLQSVQNTEIPLVRKAILAKDLHQFRTSYAQTLDACNGCHRASGHSFVTIITPQTPPVGNQRW